MLTLEDKPTRNDRLVLREEFDDWAILFDPDTGKGFGLNPVGVCIWNHLDGNHTLSDIHQTICDQFDDSPSDAPEEIRTFIEDLVQRGYAGFQI